MPAIRRSIINAAVLAALAGTALAAQNGYEQHDGRPMLGIEMSPVPLNVQTQENLSVDQGVLVRQVFPNTAASTMGIQPGDVVLQVNGSSIGGMIDLRNEVGSSGVGEPVAVVVSRNGQQVELSSAFKEWPQNIPYSQIDPAVEKNFRDWQRRHLGRTQSEVADLKKDIADLKQQLDHPGQARPIPAFEEAKALLAALPAWRLATSYEVSTEAMPAVPAEPVIAKLQIRGDDTEPAWSVSYHVDSVEKSQPAKSTQR